MSHISLESNKTWELSGSTSNPRHVQCSWKVSGKGDANREAI